MESAEGLAQSRGAEVERLLAETESLKTESGSNKKCLLEMEKLVEGLRDEHVRWDGAGETSREILVRRATLVAVLCCPVRR